MNIKNKITVQEFIKKYNALIDDEAKLDFVKLNIVSKYVPYENKKTICEKIIETTYYIKTQDDDGVEKRKLHVNSAATFMLYRLNIVNNYTTISINFQNALEEYNLLNKLGLIDMIFKLVSEKELAEIEMLLEMEKEDFVTNEYETRAFVSSQVERFAEIFGAIISPGLERLGEVIENMDDKTIDNIASKAKKIVSKFL